MTDLIGEILNVKDCEGISLFEGNKITQDGIDYCNAIFESGYEADEASKILRMMVGEFVREINKVDKARLESSVEERLIDLEYPDEVVETDIIPMACMTILNANGWISNLNIDKWDGATEDVSYYYSVTNRLINYLGITDENSDSVADKVFAMQIVMRDAYQILALGDDLIEG